MASAQLQSNTFDPVCKLRLMGRRSRMRLITLPITNIGSQVHFLTVTEASLDRFSGTFLNKSKNSLLPHLSGLKINPVFDPGAFILFSARFWLGYSDVSLNLRNMLNQALRSERSVLQCRLFPNAKFPKDLRMTGQDFELIKILIDRGSYMNTYWNFYIVVTSAIIGILATGKEFTRLKAVRGLLCIVFILFAASNFFAIQNLIDQRSALANQLTSAVPDEIMGTLRPQNVILYAAFHVLLDVVVVACILRIPWHSMKAKS